MMGHRRGMALIVAVVMRMVVIMRMIVIVTAMSVIVTMVVAVVVIIGGRSRHFAPLRAEARQLQSPRQEHQGDQSGDIDGLLNEIADLETEQVGPVAGGREISPDQNGHRGEQYNANPASAGQHTPQPLPIDGTQPEGDPAHQRQPRAQQRKDRPNHIENRLEQQTERLNKVDEG